MRGFTCSGVVDGTTSNGGLVLRLRGGDRRSFGRHGGGRRGFHIASPVGSEAVVKLVYSDEESNDESSGTPSEETTQSSRHISQNEDSSTYDPDTDDNDSEWDSVQPVSRRNKGGSGPPYQVGSAHWIAQSCGWPVGVVFSRRSSRAN